MRNLNLKIQILLLFIGSKYELNNKINNKIKKKELQKVIKMVKIL